MAQTQQSKKTKRLSLILRCGVAIGALIWVFQGQDWGRIKAVFVELNLGFLALSLGTFVVSQVLIAVRWWLLLRAQSIRIQVPAAIRLHFVGWFYNNLMPGSVGGDLLRAWYATKHTDKKLEAALSVFVDRAIGLLVLIAIAILTYSLFMPAHAALESVDSTGGSTGALANHVRTAAWLAVAIVVIVACLMSFSRGRDAAGRLWHYLAVHGAHLLRRSRDAVVVYCRKPGTMLMAVGLTAFAQSLVITAFWLLGTNIGVEAQAKHYFVFFPIMWVAAAVPVSIAGVGVLEGGIKVLFVRFAGATPEKVLALALCQRFVWVLASLPGALIHLAGAHLPKDFFIDSDDEGK